MKGGRGICSDDSWPRTTMRHSMAMFLQNLSKSGYFLSDKAGGGNFFGRGEIINWCCLS